MYIDTAVVSLPLYRCTFSRARDLRQTEVMIDDNPVLVLCLLTYIRYDLRRPLFPTPRHPYWFLTSPEVAYGQGKQYPSPSRAAATTATATAARLRRRRGRRRRPDNAQQTGRGVVVDPDQVGPTLAESVAVEQGDEAQGLDAHEPAPAHQGQDLHHAAAAAFFPLPHGWVGPGHRPYVAGVVAVVVGGRYRRRLACCGCSPSALHPRAGSRVGG